ncbi:MAG: Hsp70 family protein, partial [Akkermansia sp.]|nr:Hsp70 family protein [Akkermansia sp.]
MHTIGIDFGTTKTLVSRIIAHTGRAETVRLGQGADHIPTSLFIRPDGSMLFGNDAEDLIAEPSGVYLRGFKMKLGSSIPVHAQTTPDGKYVPYMASTLVTRYLAYIRQRVQDTVYAGEPVTRAIITRPVDFSPARLAELHKAALDAGFREVELTTEPEAAGLAFCRLNDAQAFRHSALIVDWGGGTLDVALVTREGNRILTHPKLTAGDTTIGGENFDHLLWQYAQTQLRQQGMSNINPLPMLPVIRKNKEKLSAADCATLRLSHEHGTCPPIEISRTRFNSLIQASVDRAAFLIRNLLEQIPPADKPEILLLVGGSCSIPLIKQTLEETCQLPAIYWHLSREAVSLGAALWDSTPTTPPATTAAKTESAPVT